METLWRKAGCARACAGALAAVSKRVRVQPCCTSDLSLRRGSAQKSMRNVDGRDMWPLTPSPPTHTQTTCIRNRTRAPCERGIDLKRIYSRSDYTVLNSLSCHFQTYPLPGSLALKQKPERLEWRLPTLSSSPSCVIQTHDARMERWEGPVFHSRWLPGQPQAGRHRPQQWTEVGEGNKNNFIKPQAGLVGLSPWPEMVLGWTLNNCH